MDPSLKRHHFKKHQLRALFRSVSLVGIVTVYCAYNHFALSHENSDRIAVIDGSRRLEEAVDCEDLPVAEPRWHLILYILGVLYMFLALAIVCDEFFVPSLEEMSSDRHLNLSMDVAGATLMAAGGSAPELFTALFGTFKESAVGFGTIVGSAVFNVLFVIGMCSLLSKELLHLTWWPLFRDSTCYIIGLSALAIFVGVTSEAEIELWEGLVLLSLYVGYVVVMAFNEQLYNIIKRAKKSKTSDDDFVVVDEGKRDIDYVLQEGGGRGKDEDNVELKDGETRNFRWPHTFRAGVLKLLTDPQSWSDTAGAGIVARIEGDVDVVFKHVDKNGDAMVDKEELRQVFSELECYLSDPEFDAVYEELDLDKDGMINKEEFTKWYVKSEKRMLSKAEYTFKQLDTNKSGTIDRDEVRSLLHSIDPTATEEDVSAAIQDMYKTGDKNEITYKEFSEWYIHSFTYQRQKEVAEEASEGIFANLRPPKRGCWAFTEYIVLLPLVLTLAFTVSDVCRPGMGKYCYLAFLLAIVWIGVYSYFMVDWAELIGNTLGIPPIIMGLTFLAAGTSVPDLLSSVIVARRGEGDMAVSSSIGSNIFDILVGLPLPWVIYTVYPGKPKTVSVGAEGVGISIAILVAMIALIITTIHFCGWKLTKSAGIMMFVFYFVFLAQAIYRELPFDTCA